MDDFGFSRITLFINAHIWIVKYIGFARKKLDFSVTNFFSWNENNRDLLDPSFPSHFLIGFKDFLIFDSNLDFWKSVVPCLVCLVLIFDSNPDFFSKNRVLNFGLDFEMNGREKLNLGLQCEEGWSIEDEHSDFFYFLVEY